MVATGARWPAKKRRRQKTRVVPHSRARGSGGGQSWINYAAHRQREPSAGQLARKTTAATEIRAVDRRRIRGGWGSRAPGRLVRTFLNNSRASEGPPPPRRRVSPVQPRSMDDEFQIGRGLPMRPMPRRLRIIQMGARATDFARATRRIRPILLCSPGCSLLFRGRRFAG